MPVKNVVLFEDLTSVKDLAPLSDIQQKGLEYITSQKLIGNYEEDKRTLQHIVVSPKDVPGGDSWCMESCVTAVESNNPDSIFTLLKPRSDPQEFHRYITRNEILGNLKKIPLNKIHPKQRSDFENFVRQPKSSVLLEPVFVKELTLPQPTDVILESPKPIDEAVQKLLVVSI
ncbi:MAG: hypothetical protein LBK82_01965 [Planctomycetaceae bacterium]|nr:hypothetical protein [Planctomycetaceae bacterium]